MSKTGSLTLEAARERAAKGHGYAGTCYVMAAPGGGYYLSSRVRCPRGCDHTAEAIGCQAGDTVAARFNRDGSEGLTAKRAFPPRGGGFMLGR
jgi:hypothetical protein